MKPVRHHSLPLPRALALGGLLCTGLSLASVAQAHVSYTGRDFGSYSSAGTFVIANQTVSGNYGWADATDADFGDSHKARYYRFTLTDTFDVTITAAAKADATPASIGGLLPGFTVYQGLAHLTGQKDYDYSAITQAYLATLPGMAKEGAWNALDSFKMGRDGDTNFADLTTFSFVGYAVDGTIANYASGFMNGVMGDGIADGMVAKTFRLGPGDYSIFLGGADYDAQNSFDSSPYGVSLSLNVAAVPEPAHYAMLMFGLGLVSLVARRKGRQGQL